MPLSILTGGNIAFTALCPPAPRISGLASECYLLQSFTRNRIIPVFLCDGSLLPAFSQRPCRDFRRAVLSFLCWCGLFYKFYVCRMSLFSVAKLSSVFHPCKGEAHFLILFQFETPCFSTTVYKMRQSRHPVCTKYRLWRSKTELPRLKQHTEVLSGD